MNAVNPTVVMTAMGKVGWSDPKKAGPMLDRIPLKQFAGEQNNNLTIVILNEYYNTPCKIMYSVRIL